MWSEYTFDVFRGTFEDNACYRGTPISARCMPTLQTDYTFYVFRDGISPKGVPSWKKPKWESEIQIRAG
jgi:hypothetical protein